jgi:predicted nucleic acid-binding protein
VIFVDSNVPMYLVGAPHPYSSPRLSARDALHVAVMRRRKVARILSFDAGFDGLPGVTRVS